MKIDDLEFRYIQNQSGLQYIEPVLMSNEELYNDARLLGRLVLCRDVKTDSKVLCEIFAFTDDSVDISNLDYNILPDGCLTKYTAKLIPLDRQSWDIGPIRYDR